MREQAAAAMPLGDPVAEIAANVEARKEAIAEAMLKRYQERIDSYANATPDILADAREWAHGSIEITLGIITGKLDIRDFDEALIDVGRRRALQGFPLHDVLQANLIGAEVLWETAWSIAPRDPQALTEILSVSMKATIDLLQHAVKALSHGYLEVESARVADEEYDMQALVETLAGIRQPDRRHEERADLRGIDLGSLRWCVVARVDSDSVGSAVRTLRRASPNAAVGRIGRTIIAYMPGDEMPTPDVAPSGIARADDPVRGYKRARATLEVALHLKQECVCYEDVVPLAMILGGPAEEREAFVHAQLGPLLVDAMGEDLVRSLDAYYASGNSVAAAARDLYVHRHTLEYRLQRIESLLGKDVKSPENRLLLELALAIRERPAN